MFTVIDRAVPFALFALNSLGVTVTDVPAGMLDSTRQLPLLIAVTEREKLQVWAQSSVWMKGRLRFFGCPPKAGSASRNCVEVTLKYNPARAA